MFMAIIASPVLATEDCPLRPGQIEGKTFKWEHKGFLIYAGAGILEQVEKGGNKLLKRCTMTPRTFNPKIIYNRNWYLYECGEYKLVQIDTYIRCEEAMRETRDSLGSNSYGRSLSQILSNYACSINPIVSSSTWFFRDKKGIDFPLIKNDNLLSSFKRSHLFCEKNVKWQARDELYEIGGVTSNKNGKYIVLIRKADAYEFTLIPEKIPSL